MNNDERSFTLNEAMRRIKAFCVYQDRCHKEVVKKLEEMGILPRAREQIIGQLIQENYLNEERFAKSYARGKFNIKKWGKNRIVNELKYRDIATHNIKIGLQEIEEAHYLATLDALAIKKLQGMNEKDLQKRKKKLADYLLSHGWESHLVYEKITRLIK